MNKIFNNNFLMNPYKINFEEFQRNIYNSFFEKDKNREYFINFLWYFEEFLELMLELQNYNYSNEKIKNMENLIIELSDVLAWIFSILNLENIKITEIYLFDSSLDKFDFFVFNLFYCNLYLIKSIKKRDLKNFKNLIYLIITYLVKIAIFLDLNLEIIFNRYKVCPKCFKEKCIC
jgi:NTP pyrophosphatase (non-canonical NTP hydrolase)